MPIYRCPIIGDGSDHDAFRAPYLGDDPRIGYINLSVPNTPNGFGFLYLPADVADGRLEKLADSHDEALSTANRSRIGNAFGVTLQQVSMRDVIAELLMDHGRNDGTRWTGIRGFPSRRRSQYEVFLGGLGMIWSQKVAPRPSSQTLTETWPTDGTTIATGQDNAWNDDDGNAEISSGVATNNTINFAGYTCTDDLDTDDHRHYLEFQLNNGSVLIQIRVGVRWTDRNNAYAFWLSRNGNSQTSRKRVGGSNTQFATNSNDPGASGNAECEIDGATVTCRLGGSQIFQNTDGSPSFSGVLTCGFSIYRAAGSAQGEVTADNHTMADVVAAYSLALAQGSYALTGQATGLAADRQIPLAQGSYALTGQTVALLRGFPLAAVQGSYTLTGQSLGLAADRTLGLTQGAYVLTGQAVSALADRILAIAQGSYSVTGQNVGTILDRAIALAQGSYSLSGQDVGLTYTPVGGYSLALGQGSYALTGQATSLIVDRLLALAQGSYVLTGQAAALLRDFPLSAEAGAYVLTGQAAAALADRALALAQGSYAVDGQIVVLTYSGTSTPTPASRVFVVDSESRVFAIDIEDRVFPIQ